MMATGVLRLPGLRELPKSVPKAVKSIMDTMYITPEGVARWEHPPFQREIKTNQKVLDLAEELKQNGGVISGIITLGKLDTKTYIVDGQHRLRSFELSKLPQAIADVRICTFDTMGDMGEEFARLNSALRRFTIDDLLRGLEGTNDWLQLIRKRCPYVGYDNLRHRTTTKPKLVAMSSLLRCWFGSVNVPQLGMSAAECVPQLSKETTEQLLRVLAVCFEAWGYDKENFKLWGVLNLSITFWLWRRLVLREGLSTKQKGGLSAVTLDDDKFRACLMALSANARYLEWLRGRNLNARDRTPGYARMKEIFQGRLAGMGYGKPYLPLASWEP